MLLLLRAVHALRKMSDVDEKERELTGGERSSSAAVCRPHVRATMLPKIISLMTRVCLQRMRRPDEGRGEPEGVSHFVLRDPCGSPSRGDGVKMGLEASALRGGL